jgi:hypothetical protein
MWYYHRITESPVLYAPPSHVQPIILSPCECATTSPTYTKPVYRTLRRVWPHFQSNIRQGLSRHSPQLQMTGMSKILIPDVRSKAATVAETSDQYQWTVHHNWADSALEAGIAKLDLGPNRKRDPFHQIRSGNLIALQQSHQDTYRSLPNDSYTWQTSRKLNDLFINSELIQYIIHTAFFSMFDSLALDPGLSLPKYLEVLERRETVWQTGRNGSLRAEYAHRGTHPGWSWPPRQIFVWTMPCRVPLTSARDT